MSNTREAISYFSAQGRLRFNITFERRILECWQVRNLVAHERTMLTGVRSLVTYEAGMLTGTLSRFRHKKEMLTSVWRLVTYEIGMLERRMRVSLHTRQECWQAQCVSLHTRKKCWQAYGVPLHMRRECWRGVWKSCHIRDKNVDRRYIRNRNVDRRMESRNMRNIALLLTLGTECLFPGTEIQNIQTGI